MLQVTIAIPVYNAERYLHNTIQSVINQSYRNWVLYLINDGSTDNSLSMMHEFSACDSRIHVIDDGCNRGLVARLNQSVSITNTKYYARMDADDIMYVTRIEEQVKFLEEHPEIDVLGTSVMTIDNENRIIGSGMYSGEVEGFIHPTVMGKTEWFKANPYCDWAVRAEDFELWSRTSSKSVFYSLDKPLLFYREFGVPTLKKTLQSLYMVFKISSRYRKYGKPFSWFVRKGISSILKMFVYCFFAALGKMDYVVSMRKRKPLPKVKRLSESDLSRCIQA